MAKATAAMVIEIPIIVRSATSLSAKNNRKWIERLDYNSLQIRQKLGQTKMILSPDTHWYMSVFKWLKQQG